MAKEIIPLEIQVCGTTVRSVDFYTPAQTAQILGISVKTLNRRVQDGVLKRSGYARSILYKGEHIIKSLNKSPC